MFILYFNTNSNEIVVYFLIVLIVVAFVIVMLILDKVNQDKALKQIVYETDFYSLLTNDYFLDYDKQVEEEIIEKIRVSIRHFNSIQFKTFVSDIFLKSIDTFTKNDVDMIRQLCSNESYNLVKNIIENARINQHTIHIKDYKHNLIQITGYNSNEDYEEIFVTLYYSAKLFTLDANQKLLYGNPNVVHDFKADLKFMVNADIKNNPTTYITPKTYCLKCGNIMSLTENGRCEYCDLDVQGGNSHWILESFAFSSALILDDIN